ncbi:MAG: Phytochrome, two-component sensor histidine kinase, partial [uncultured Solirubrobacteraceae bacterium]
MTGIPEQLRQRGAGSVPDDPARPHASRQAAPKDGAVEATLDRLARLAADVLSVPVALVWLAHDERQIITGGDLPEPWTHQDVASLCRDVVASREPLVVAHARVTPPSGGNLALPGIGAVAYVGVPLIAADGRTLGCLCAIDHHPRAWSAEDRTRLGDLAAVALSEIELWLLAREAAESERFLQGTLDALGAHVAIIDDAGTILAVNAAWRRFAAANGLPWPDAGIGTNYLAACEGATGDEAGEAAAVAAGIRAVLSGARATYEREYPCHSPTQERWFVARVTRFAGPGPTRAVVAHENITARRLAERDRDLLLAGVTHDLKNPLAGVKGLAQLGRRRLLRGVPAAGAGIMESLGTIEAQADRMARLLDEQLDAARGRAGADPDLHPRPADLVALLRAAVAEQEHLARGHTLRLESGEGSLVGVWDRDQLERVFGNLLDNAVKYSRPGGAVTISLAREGDATGGWARVAVRDGGVGVPAAELP